MMEHDDIKASVLQDLIEKLMEMKTGSDKPDMHADPMAEAMGKPKMGILAIAKPADDDDDQPGMDDGDEDDKGAGLASLLSGAKDHAAPDADDMKKPLGQDDFAMMKRKQMGL